ncbi:MAG: hypothetical protein M0Z41_07005 [Peptococcaceae bacterium]|nr:hypothetical protein [Peptococcaceae bacterium]
MHNALAQVRIKLQALGFTKQQIDSIVEGTLSGKRWEEMSAAEKWEVVKSLDTRIDFYKKFIQGFGGFCQVT